MNEPEDEDTDPDAPFFIEMGSTGRGFSRGEFKDRYNEACSIQMSSLATEDALWLGITNPKPLVCVKGEGWKEVPLPPGASISGRMHLTRPMARTLAVMLQHFADTGELRHKSALEHLADQAD